MNILHTTEEISIRNFPEKLDSPSLFTNIITPTEPPPFDTPFNVQLNSIVKVNLRYLLCALPRSFILIGLETMSTTEGEKSTRADDLPVSVPTANEQALCHCVVPGGESQNDTIANTCSCPP